MEVKCLKEEIGHQLIIPHLQNFVCSESHVLGEMSCEQCPGTWDVWIRREPGVRWHGRHHSCYRPLHGVGTDWFCIASEDYVCLQREIFESTHQEHLLMKFSRTNGLTYEINFLSVRTLKQKQADNLLGRDSCTRRGCPLSLNYRCFCDGTWPYAHR